MKMERLKALLMKLLEFPAAATTPVEETPHKKEIQIRFHTPSPETEEQ